MKRSQAKIAAQPGRGSGRPASSYERGIDLYYFTNALKVDEASFEHMDFFKLRADANNTTCMSSCCGTLMCGIHPIYGGHTISVNADSCRVTVPSVRPSKLIGFGGDIPADKCEEIRQRDTRPLVMSFEAEIAEPHMVELLAAVTAPVAERFSREGRTFEALCAAKNNTRIGNAFFEESRAGRPRV